MLFCGTELARRIEAAEREWIEDCAAAVARAVGGSFVRPIAGGAAVFAGAESPLSKSHENAQRHGFELLYARAILRRDACSGRTVVPRQPRSRAGRRGVRSVNRGR